MIRRPLGKSQKLRILQENEYRCFYCGGPADVIDHIIPYSYSANNTDTNLIAACSICNSIASDKVFDNLVDKQSYILQERKRSKWQKRIAQQIDIPIPVQPIRLKKVKTPKKHKPVIDKAALYFCKKVVPKSQDDPVPVIKPKPVFIEPQKTAIPNIKAIQDERARELCNLIIRYYDNGEDCMDEIKRFYRRNGGRV